MKFNKMQSILRYKCVYISKEITDLDTGTDTVNIKETVL